MRSRERKKMVKENIYENWKERNLKEARHS